MLFEICKWENSKTREQKTDANCCRGFMVSYTHSRRSKPFHRIQDICLQRKLGLFEETFFSATQVHLPPHFLL